MLNVYMPAYSQYTPPGKLFYQFDRYFVSRLSDDWFTPAVNDALMNIDKGVYLHNGAFATEYLGVIPASWISGGFKALACIANVNFKHWTDMNYVEHIGEDWYVESSSMGYNVYKYLGPIVDALPYDLNLLWDTSVDPDGIGDAPIHGRIVGTDFVFNSWKEFTDYVFADLCILLDGEYNDR